MNEAGPETQRPLPSVLRVAWLIVAFGLRRAVNRFLALIRKKQAPAARRGAIARKRAPGGILAAIGAAAILASGVMQAMAVVGGIADKAERASGDVAIVDGRIVALVGIVDEWVRDERAGRPSNPSWREALRQGLDRQLQAAGMSDGAERTQRVAQLARVFEERGPAGFRQEGAPGALAWASSGLWYGGGDGVAMLAPLGLIVLLLMISIALMSIVGPNQDLARTDWIFEWWFTFPVSARGLLLARIVETAVANPYAWFTLLPFLSVTFWCAGYAWSAIPLGMAAALYVGVVAGSLRVVAETTLRRLLALRNVARLQAVLATLGVITFFAALGSVSQEWLATLIGLAQRLPSWLLLNPFTPVSLAAGGAQAAIAAFGCAALAIAAMAGATAIGGWMLRDGLTAGGGPDQGRRRRVDRARARLGVALDPVMRKELLLLRRDRTMLAGVFVMPVLVIGAQLLMTPSLAKWIDADPRLAAAMAFGAAVLVLATGACNTLVVEVPTLWIWCTVPRSIDRVLIRKAMFWGCVAVLNLVIAFVLVTRGAPAVLRAGAPALALALVGVALHAFVATAVGAIGTDALESEPRRRIRSSMVVLTMVLASTFTYALYAPSAWAKLVLIVLTAALGYALWQKVRDRAPYLLDPDEVPARALAVADGVIAALSFFVLQGLLAPIFAVLAFSPGAGLLLAFVGAGSVVAGGTLLVLARGRVPDLLATIGFRRPLQGFAPGVLGGIAGGLACGLLATGYLALIERIGFLARIRDETVALSPDAAAAAPWLAALTVLAAPVFEEFIFRGVLYGGFRRTLTPLQAAVASALVFAIIHPAIASGPVFVLGLITAVLYERSRSLAAPVAAHMAYNATLVALAWWSRP